MSNLLEESGIEVHKNILKPDIEEDELDEVDEDDLDDEESPYDESLESEFNKAMSRDEDRQKAVYSPSVNPGASRTDFGSRTFSPFGTVIRSGSEDYRPSNQIPPWGGGSSVYNNSSEIRQQTSPSPFFNSQQPSSQQNTWFSRNTYYNNYNNSGKTISIGDKRILVVDLVDVLIETMLSQGHPGMQMRGVWDLRLRFEVWSKIRTLKMNSIIVIAPSSFTDANSQFSVVLEYSLTCLSDFLSYPSNQIFVIGEDYGNFGYNIMEGKLNSLISDRNLAMWLGVRSVSPGQGRIEYIQKEGSNEFIEKFMGVDYVEVNKFLTNNYY